MKILVAYDKNEATYNVMDQAMKRAMKLGATVYLIRSSDPDVDGYELRQMEDQLEEMGQDVFKQNGIEYENHILIRGLSPGEDIVEFAKENKVDEIIIGVKRKSKVGKLVFGSTAQFVILEAHCPVLCVK